MAHCALSPTEFVQNTFNPVIAVLSTAKAEAMCRRNNLSFVEMVQPFCKLNTEAHLRDPVNPPYPLRNLRITLSDMNSEPPKAAVARRMLYEAVASTVPNMGDGSRVSTVRTSGYTVQINGSTPWFEAYRDCFMRAASTSDHEFIGHFLACMFVVAASETDPLQEFANLAQQQQNHQQHSGARPVNKWFFPVALRYYVLLHDVTECEQTKTESIFKSVQDTYGSTNCYLLKINSRNAKLATAGSNHEDSGGIANLPDPWSQFLTRKVDITEEPSEWDSVSMLNENGNDVIGNNQESENNGINNVDHPLMPHYSQETSVNDFAIKIETESSSLNNVPTISDAIGIEGQTLGSILDESNVVGSEREPSPSLQSGGHHAVQHGTQLTLADVEQLKLLVQEFCLKSLLPFVEKQMNFMHESVANRKGLHRSFFSATKKWFGGNKPGPAAGNVPTSFVVYSPDAVELQIRRLGDLAFMFQNYELAYHAYHNGKRDFNSDQAWMHFAGTLEMAALAVFMQGATSQRPLPFHYFDNAITTYLHTCKSPHYATRATLLGTECLKFGERYLEAAGYFIRLTSEESDLRSALLLEQAAHCFANLKNPCVRKYAFYMILAGHRFNKAGQKKHSLRSYKQALQVYEGRQWLLAEDHINLTAGRLNFSLGRLREAMLCFHKLLYDGSQQCEVQQAYYLREYLAICNHLWSGNTSCHDHQLPELPLPVIDSQNCTVRLGDKSDPQEFDNLGLCDGREEALKDEADWHRLEEIGLAAIAGNSVLYDKPRLHWHNSTTDNSKNPVAIVDELITVELNVRNPLKVPLFITKLHLLWSFNSEDESETPAISNLNSNSNEKLETGVVDELLLEGMQSRTIDLVMRPRQTGTVKVQGIAYGLTTPQLQQQQQLPVEVSKETHSTPDTASASSNFSVSGMQPLKVIGPRLNKTKAQQCGKVYREDRRLEPVVMPPMPRLVVKQLHFPKYLLCGQVAPMTLEFVNRGQVGLRQLLLVTSHPQSIAIGSPSANQPSMDGSAKAYYDSPRPVSSNPANDGHRSNRHLYEAGHVFTVSLPADLEVLEPGQRFWLPTWIRGPDTAGSHVFSFIFYYQTAAASSKHEFGRHITPQHRVYRCHAKLQTTTILSASAIAISGAKPVECAADLPQSLILALEVANVHQDLDGSNAQLAVSQILCASRGWKLEPIGQSAIRDLSIGTKEAVHLCFRAMEIKSDILDKDTGQLLQYSNVSFKEKEVCKIDVSATPYFAHHLTEPINRVVDPDRPDNWESKAVVNSEQDSTAIVPSKETATTSNQSLSVTLTLVIFWEAIVGNDLIVYGEHRLNLTSLDVLVSTRPETKTIEEKPPVRFFPMIESSSSDYAKTLASKTSESAGPYSSQQLRYFLFTNSDGVQHDFSNSSTCVVPVFLVLYNCTDMDILARIDTGHIQRVSPLATSAVPSPSSGEGSRFVWVGATRLRHMLCARQTKVVKLKACFFHSGTYALNGVTVHTKLVVHDQPETLQMGIGQLVIIGTASSRDYS